MAIVASIFIRNSVGQGGRNELSDVRAIQQQLNGHLMAPRQGLTVDGRSGPKTVGMIRDFQSGVVGLRSPDGRVDPNGKTLAALNDPASKGKWARMSIGAPATTAASLGAGAGASKGQALLDQEAARGGMQSTAQEIKGLAAAKTIISALDSADKARVILGAWKVLRAWGFSTAETQREIYRLMSDHRRMPLLEQVANPISPMASRLSKVAKGAGRVAIVLAVLEISIKVREGQYGAATGEAYKLAMGYAVPWGGLVDAIQSVVESLMPGSAKNTMLFKALRGFDPLALGAVAADSVVTLAIGLANMIQTGQLSHSDLEKLVTRMKSSPAALIAEFGDAAGDGLFEMSRWKREDWSYAFRAVPGFLYSLVR